MDFCDRYSRHFIGQGYNSAGHARDYLSGLTGTQRRENIEIIENDIKGSNSQLQAGNYHGHLSRAIRPLLPAAQIAFKLPPTLKVWNP